MKPNNGIKMITVIFAIIGACIIMGGVIFIKSAFDFQKNALETEATITNIERYYDSDGDSHYNVLVEFKVEGKRYSGQLDYYSSGMYEGGTTKVYYNPDNPNEFRSSSNIFAGVIILMIGVIFFAVGFGMCIGSNRKKRNQKRLMEIGTRVYVDFEEVRQNFRFSYNGRHPWQIVCTSDNPEIDEYISENIWRNPQKIIEQRNITAFPVYIDPENPKKYYLSTEEIDEYISNK